MVSSARKAPSSTTVNFGVSSAVEISVPLADLRAQQAQPPRCQQAGVDREQVVARRVHQPLGGPQLPADPAAHRVIALAQAAATAGARRAPSAPRRRPRAARVATASTAARARSRRPATRCRGCPAHHREARAERQQRHPAEQDRRHAVHRHPERRARGPLVGPGMAGLAGLHRRRALPVLAGLDLADHAGSRCDVGVLADHGPGSSVVRAPMVASLPTVIGADVERSPSIQCPVRSTSGSMEHRWPR